MTARSFIPLLAVLALSLPVGLSDGGAARAPFAFALDYPAEVLAASRSARREFLLRVCRAEGAFAAHMAGANTASGLTYDGTAVDYETGLARCPLHTYSAPSKESLQLAVFALALENATCAGEFVAEAAARANMSADSYMADQLRRKADSYRRFQSALPGFGGFFPWFDVTDQGMTPARDWASRVPALDNGELAWAMVALSDALRRRNLTDLAGQYEGFVDAMAGNVLAIFYSGEGRMRCDARIRDARSPNVTRANYEDFDACSLSDPYEGELLTFFADLYANWTAAGYPPEERERMWSFKRPLLQRATLQTAAGPVDVEKGFHFSSHERWKYLFLPYLDSSINRRVVVVGEVARTQYSADRNLSGLFAAAANVTDPGDYFPPYVDTSGVPGIGFQPVHNAAFTPYAAFPLFLDPKTRLFGVLWHAATVRGSKMQGPLGSTEAVSVDGSRISPLATWDTKVTTVVAIDGGAARIARRALEARGLYGRFLEVVDREWTAVFGTGPLQGEALAPARPPGSVPNVLPGFTGRAAGSASRCNATSGSGSPRPRGRTFDGALLSAALLLILQ